MRLCACLVVFGFIACAPSVPRPTREPPAPDAGVDLPATTTPVTVDARPDVRQPPEPAVDAHSDVLGDVARDAAIKTDAGLKPDALPNDVARADVKPDLTKADTNVGSDSGPDYDRPRRARPRPAPPRPSYRQHGAAILPAAGDLVIDELLINPAGTDTNREWIEVVNVSTATLDLHQLHVADAASDVAVDAGVLAPGGLLVLGQSLDPTKNGGAPIAFSFGNVISLNNGGDSISLCLGPCASGVVLDQVAWTADLGAAYDGHAAIVGAVPGQFCPADQPFGDAGSFGSPGTANPPCVAVTRPTRGRGARAAGIVLSPVDRKTWRPRPHPWPRCWPGNAPARRRRDPEPLRRLRRRHRARALPGAGRGDPRAGRRQERHPQHADRLGQVAGRDRAALQRDGRGQGVVLHLPDQGAGQREVLRALRALRPRQRRA